MAYRDREGKEDVYKLLLTRRERTQQRIAYLTNAGYSVSTIWECVYKEHIENTALVEKIKAEYLPPFFLKYGKTKKVTESLIVDAIRSGDLFGAVEVDVSVPSELYDYFKEFSPIFCTTTIPYKYFGEHMKEYFECNNFKKHSRTLLVGAMSAEKILLSSPLLRFYLERGLVITHVYQVIEFVPKPCFAGFVQEMVSKRRQGDDPVNPQEMISTLAKYLSNSAFGSMLLNKNKYTRIRYVKGTSRSSVCANNKRFKSMEHIGQDIYEIESFHKSIDMDVVVQIGFFILCAAKKHICCMYYITIDRYFLRADFELLYMDTDGFIIAFSKKNIADCVVSELRKEFMEKVYYSCTDSKAVSPKTGFWFNRECCTRHAIWDSKSPGLFKYEVRNANKMIALSSKTYILQGEEKNKLSAKGVNKNHFTNEMEKFESVLRSKNNVQSTNRGIKYCKSTNRVYTYSLYKNALSYIYVKRTVHSDGVTTSPIKMTVSPWQKTKEVYFNGTGHVFSPYYNCKLRMFNLVFNSAEHLFYFYKCTYHDDLEAAHKVFREPNSLKVYGHAKHLPLKLGWIKIRDAFMREILLQKMNLRDVQYYISQQNSERVYVFCSQTPYWSCGLGRDVAEVISSDSYPDQNALGKMWCNLLSKGP